MKKRIVNYPESRQLFEPIPKLKLYSHLSGDELITLDSDKLPFMTWPDGKPCFLANAYMVRVRELPGRGGNGPSREGEKGGTLGEYAAQISSLIRFCYYNKLNFIDISDDDFCEFIDGLRTEYDPRKPHKRKKGERRITTIGRKCLRFLAYVGEVYGIHNHVGIGGTISIEMVDSIYYRNGKAFKRASVHHRSFRTPEAKKSRKPIGEATIQKLRDTIDDISISEFLCTRRQLMISLFSETGGRRGEVHEITVAQILNAAKVKAPFVRLKTLKHGGNGEVRDISLSSPLLRDLLNYIHGERYSLMKRFKGSPDHGFLFVTERGGRHMTRGSITTEFSKIRRAAGIEEQACAHLFRHTFCTDEVAKLIAETKALSPDSFRQTLMTNKMIAERALSRSGHATLESLLTYVDDAYKEKSKFEKVVHNVETAKMYENYQKRMKRLLEALKSGKISTDEYIERTETLMADRDRDLMIA